MIIFCELFAGSPNPIFNWKLFGPPEIEFGIESDNVPTPSVIDNKKSFLSNSP